jgi:hypothetical protein
MSVVGVWSNRNGSGTRDILSKQVDNRISFISGRGRMCLAHMSRKRLILKTCSF